MSIPDVQYILLPLSPAADAFGAAPVAFFSFSIFAIFSSTTILSLLAQSWLANIG